MMLDRLRIRKTIKASVDAACLLFIGLVALANPSAHLSLEQAALSAPIIQSRAQLKASLAALGVEIIARKANLGRDKRLIETERTQLQALGLKINGFNHFSDSQNQIAAYNALVKRYENVRRALNSHVTRYNKELALCQLKINQYNDTAQEINKED